MKVVVDSNRLQSQALRTFLQRSPANMAVLTDYAAMEAYKGDALVSIFKSMEILCDFPKQVIVLKGARAICQQRGRQAGLQRRMIDDAQTKGFAEYAFNLRKANVGNSDFRAQLLEHGREATAHLARMRQGRRVNWSAGRRVREDVLKK